jgi:hypothetical protein
LKLNASFYLEQFSSLAAQSNHETISARKGAIMNLIKLLALGVCVVVLLTQAVRAADAFYHIPVASLKLTEGALPVADAANNNARSWQMLRVVQPYATIDGGGEAYVSGNTQSWDRENGAAAQTISIRATEGKEITGRLFLPKLDLSGMVQVRFKISPTDAKPETQKDFLAEKLQFYRQLQDRNIAGAAWFRHQVATARGTNSNSPENFNPRFNRLSTSELEDTFELFTGGRALSENLQLDRALPAISNKSTNSEAVTNLAGITVQAINWKPLLKGTNTALDPLAAFIPADQHALFFPSFAAMTTMIDEADANGTPVLQTFEARSEDAGSRSRYQKQICLELNELSRLLGPQVVSSAAFTGSDPFLRAGTDLAILFESPTPQLVQANVIAQQALALTANPGAKKVSGEIEGVSFVGVVSLDRSVSSYMAAVSNVVLVTNSRKQLENLLRTASGKNAALSSQDEYVYFRQKYVRGEKDETAFLVLSDATIRRWCGAQCRIADSRRTRAAAVLSDLQAAHLDELVGGKVAATVLHPEYFVPELGEVKLTAAGVASSTYGTLGFMIPISEIAPATVTQDEAAAYGRWRDNYERNWRQYFDPIAMRFSISKNKLNAELTVMPLITGSRYNEFLGITTGAQIAAGAGDPHTNALARLAIAINTQSKTIQEAGNFVGNMAPGLKANFLAWLGQSITLYADDDDFWNDLNAATNADVFMEHSYSRLPVALHCEVKSSLGVVAFLASLHAFVDQSAPQMTTWQNLEYNGRSYVKVASNKLSAQSEPGDDWSLYYAVTPDSLTVTLSEALLKRALDRQAARMDTNAVVQVGKSWLGSNLCFQVEQKLIGTLLKASHDDYQTHLQTLAWNNLPILNEWKRLYPGKDPVKWHEELWGVKLICPGGGAYVWNEKWQTMESTVFGHPGEPKAGAFTSPLAALLDANLGVTFENQGLNAKAVVNRKSSQ